MYSLFQSITAESIGATEFVNYTSDAIDMYSYVQDIVENPSQCCNYSYQILDKFCARQQMVSNEQTSSGSVICICKSVPCRPGCSIPNCYFFIITFQQMLL